MTYVMSDIHGNLQRFESILAQIKLQATDRLFILGDVVDRYPGGIKILRRIMKMPNVTMLLGNHEYMMYHAIAHCRDAAEEKEHTNWRERRRWYQNGGRVTHDYLKHIPKACRAEVFEFIKNLPLNIDVEVNGTKYKLVHGSPVENIMRSYYYARSYASIAEFAVWERWYETSFVPEGYILVFGHTPTCHYHDVEPWSIWRNEEAIGIDCGCGYPEGRLACLRLDDMKEFYSEG